MAQRYVLSAEAIADLIDLQTFLTERAGAERTLTIPGAPSSFDGRALGVPGHRPPKTRPHGAPYCHPVQSWLIFYRPTADRTAVEIIRVIDGRRDIQEVLGRPKV